MEAKLIDQQALAALVQQEISEAARQQVQQMLADPAWLSVIEKRTVEMLAARVEARLSNINDDPDLNSAVQSAIRSIFDHGFVPDITRYVSSDKFKHSVDLGITEAVKDVIADLSLDPTWLARVETMVNQQMHVKVNRYISDLSIEDAVRRNLGAALDRWLETNQVLRTPGIDDQGQKIELTVMDGTVVVEGELAAACANIIGDAAIDGTLSVKDLRVTGSIDVTEPSWNQISARAAQGALDAMTNEWRQSLIDDINRAVREQGIDFDQVMINGQPLIQHGRLASGITHSNLQSLGLLDNLAVQGHADLKGPVSITNSENLGLRISTEADGVQLRTLAQMPLRLQVGDTASVDIHPDAVDINQLRVSGCKISFAASVPGYRGKRGDLVFNSEPTPGGAFAWVCLGAFSWQALKASS